MTIIYRSIVLYNRIFGIVLWFVLLSLESKEILSVTPEFGWIPQWDILYFWYRSLLWSFQLLSSSLAHSLYIFIDTYESTLYLKSWFHRSNSSHRFICRYIWSSTVQTLLFMFFLRILVCYCSRYARIFPICDWWCIHSVF